MKQSDKRQRHRQVLSHRVRQPGGGEEDKNYYFSIQLVTLFNLKAFKEAAVAFSSPAHWCSNIDDFTDKM